MDSARIESVDCCIFARLRLVADLGYPTCFPVMSIMRIISESHHHLYNLVGGHAAKSDCRG